MRDTDLVDRIKSFNPDVDLRVIKKAYNFGELMHGDKKVFLDKYFAESKIDAKNVIYLGNDVNDLTSLQFVGYPVIVSNSDISLFKYNFRILKSNGGNGALKELLNLLK